MTTLMQHYKTALVRKSGWLKKILGLSCVFFLLKGLLWLTLFSVVILKNLS